jgi:hypothetical protein
MTLVKSPERLDSWKEIAGYLGKDERTVQRWEAECALPVHRTPGRRRGSVFAYKQELDLWLAGQSATASQAPSLPPDATPSPSQPRGVRRLVIGAIAVLSIVLLAAGAMTFGHRASHEALRLNLVADRIIGLDQQGQRVWEYRLREPSDWPPDTSKSWRLIDLVGKPVFLVRVGRKNGDGGELDCLSADGVLLWRYEPKMSLKFGSQVDDGPWFIEDFEFVSILPKPRLWAAVGDSVWGHSFISEIDTATGQSDVRFVNNGSIYAIRSVTAKNTLRLVAGGFNNEYDLPFLATLDPGQEYAVSPQTPGTRFYCENCGQGSPQKYFVMPRSELNQMIGQAPNAVHHIELLGSTLQVSTNELSENNRAIYFFSTTPDVAPQSITFASTYWTEHRRLEREGRLKHPAERCSDYVSPRPIRAWTPGEGWSELRVDYIPKGGIPEKIDAKLFGRLSSAGPAIEK